MFGFGKSRAEVQKEALIAQSKQMVTEMVNKMSDASPEDAERLAEMIKSRCKDDKYLPFDFNQKVFKAVRRLQCNANMRSADKLLRDAARLAAEEKMKERGVKLADARQYFTKACSLGADDDWRKAYARLQETILLTGGVHRDGPTRAKPAVFAPVNPNNAKA
ncbi:MAG: hypothetical protein WCZ23_03880 [Rhodospirillaceae bacterium]